MNTVRCPKCDAQLVLPNADVASCQCSRCHEVFAPQPVRIERPHTTSDVPDDGDPDFHDAMVLKERERFRESLQHEHPESIDREHRWRSSARSFMIGFFIGCLLGPVFVVLEFFLLINLDCSHGIGAGIAAGIQIGFASFVCRYLALTKPLTRRTWPFRVLLGIWLVWIVAVMLLQWQSIHSIEVGGLMGGGLSGLLILLFSWCIIVGWIRITDKSERT